MALNLGATTIRDLRLGAARPSKVMLGDALLWPPGELWTPTEIATDVWLDAADTSTIILNGTTVQSWLDKSGNNRHFGQSNANQQPDHAPSREALSFSRDGVVSLFVRGGALNLGGNVTVFFAVQPVGTLVGLFDSSDSQDTTSRTPARTNWWGCMDRWMEDSPGFPLNFAADEPAQFNVQHFFTGSRVVDYRKDGALVSSNPGNNDTVQPITWLNTVIGGVNGGHNSRYSGVVHECVICQNSELTGGNIQRIEGYLAHKWNAQLGLVAKLPVDHPYKLYPPLK